MQRSLSNGPASASLQVLWDTSLLNESPNNRMQRAAIDKVHAPDRHLGLMGSDFAPQGQRAVADAGR